jgi:hypothetical protein
MEKRNFCFIKKVFCFIGVAVYSLSFSTCKSDSSDSQEEAPLTWNISGTVTKSDGGAASGASVMLVNTSDNSNAGQSPSNAAGEYIITGVVAGSYKITATLNGYETGSIDAVKIVDSDVTGKDIVLQKITVPTYVIGGAVTKPDGSAAAGASVQIRRVSDNTDIGQAATTGVSGCGAVSL